MANRTIELLVLLILSAMITASSADDSVSFSRDIAPILAANCYQCHGPDASKRETEFRLDDEKIANEILASGKKAIVPGSIKSSELFQRILAEDESRMPPADSGRQLSAKEIQMIRLWIEQGATWDAHWAFRRLRKPSVPHVNSPGWANNAIDHFVLAKLEKNNLTPALSADTDDLWRRIHIDVTGLLPEAPVPGEPFSLTYPQLVDRLLSSPRFGEKWGRHWLDIARYSDSNGADENHYYPNAFHYRDWVIQAMNTDLAFDRFVAQQIAGDALVTKNDPMPMIGTGYLAIGLKILAEQDAEKKRMDIIDEQLDTLGQTFLGLSIACARCHDHKFDPITAKDYYAMAGILYSSTLADQPLKSADFLARSSIAQTIVTNLNRQITTANSKLKVMLKTGDLINRQAEKFDRGNVIVDNENYGKEIGIIGDPGPQDNYAEYDFVIENPGTYILQLRYAALNSRPGRILLDGKVVNDKAISRTTGSWMPDSQTWFTECRCDLAEGKNTIRLESKPLMSHIDQLRLIRTTEKDGLGTTINLIQELEKELEKAKAAMPKSPMVMAIADAEVSDLAIHLRGSHLNLGESVPRGFLQRLTQSNSTLPSNSSGRLEFARWLTDPNSAASDLVARVIVNRIWHWYFGRGLVESPNEFGLRGSRPSHPALLDYLAGRLLQSGWSMKSIHREILLSSTYRMSTTHNGISLAATTPSDGYLSTHPRKRIPPEVFRDLLFQLRGDLDLRMGGAPPKVVSQNPSPEDSRKNQEIYDRARRRSIYLPIVRSNTYDLFTNFDFPDASASVGKRSETIVPTQALLMMNGMLLKESAAQITERLDRSGALNVQAVFQELFSRSVLPEESAVLMNSLGKNPDKSDYELMVHTLLMSNQFMYQK